jgi:hypothetical protein
MPRRRPGTPGPGGIVGLDSGGTKMAASLAPTCPQCLPAGGLHGAREADAGAWGACRYPSETELSLGATFAFPPSGLVKSCTRRFRGNAMPLAADFTALMLTPSVGGVCGCFRQLGVIVTRVCALVTGCRRLRRAAAGAGWRRGGPSGCPDSAAFRVRQPERGPGRREQRDPGAVIRKCCVRPRRPGCLRRPARASGAGYPVRRAGPQ